MHVPLPKIPFELDKIIFPEFVQHNRKQKKCVKRLYNILAATLLTPPDKTYYLTLTMTFPLARPLAT